MNQDDFKVITLYKRLLEILDKEQEEITKRDIDGIEYFCAAKIDIMNELAALEAQGYFGYSVQQISEVESLTIKVMNMNKANSEAVMEMKKSVAREIAGLCENKNAIKAYKSNS